MDQQLAVIKYLLDRYVPTGAVFIDSEELRSVDRDYDLAQVDHPSSQQLALRKPDNGPTEWHGGEQPAA